MVGLVCAHSYTYTHRVASPVVGLHRQTNTLQMMRAMVAASGWLKLLWLKKKKRVMLCFLGSTVEKKSRRAGAEGEEMDECGWT